MDEKTKTIADAGLFMATVMERIPKGLCVLLGPENDVIYAGELNKIPRGTIIPGCMIVICQADFDILDEHMRPVLH